MRIKSLFTCAVCVGVLALAGLPRAAKAEDPVTPAQGIIGKTAPCEEAQMTQNRSQTRAHIAEASVESKH